MKTNEFNEKLIKLAVLQVLSNGDTSAWVVTRTVKEKIGDTFCVHPPQVYRAIDRLKEKRCIILSHDEQGRPRLRITEEGKVHIDKLMKEVEAELIGVAEAITKG